MDASRYLTVLKPNVTSLGYALFLAVNAAGVWGGVFPFLPNEFQTPQIIFRFFLTQSLVFSFSYFASAIGVYFIPTPTRRFLVVAAAVPYFLGWCALIGAIYVDSAAMMLVSVGGGLLGVGSAGFFMMWQRLFASQEADRGNHDLILGTAYGALLYFSLYLIPDAVTAFLIPLVFLPLFGLCIVLQSRTIDLAQPMFEEEPRAHPRVYRQLLQDYWRSALSIGALGFCSGVIRSLVISDPQVGSWVNVMSMGGSLLMALALLFLWQAKNIRINVNTAYRVFFPFVITGFLVLPFLSLDYATVLASVIYAAYSCAIILMMIQCAQASRDRGINPIFIYGFFAGIVYILHDIGFIGESFIENSDVVHMEPIVVVALFAVYLLSFMYFLGSGGFRQVLAQRRHTGAENIEFVALNRTQPDKDIVDAEIMKEESALLKTEVAPVGFWVREKPQYRDRVSKQCALLQQHYRLSAREAEVMELIARGNSAVRIAEELVVSENTIRTHSKRIYTKLAIHKKQELLDLIDAFNPSDLAV